MKRFLIIILFFCLKYAVKITRRTIALLLEKNMVTSTIAALMFLGVTTYFLIRLKLLPKIELTAGTVNRKKKRAEVGLFITTSRDYDINVILNTYNYILPRKFFIYVVLI